jgi:hypothetical protein
LRVIADKGIREVTLPVLGTHVDNARGARTGLFVVLGLCAAALLVVVAVAAGQAMAVGSPETRDRAGPVGPATHPPEFPVTFTENGLPSGTNWSVSLDETTRSSVSSTIVLEEPNGTYQLYTWDVKGYLSYANVTTLDVSGNPVNATVNYTAPAAGTYYVTFVQSGLPFNVSWEVLLSAIINGTTEPGGVGQSYIGPTHTPPGQGLENATFAWTAFHPSVPDWPIPTYYPFPSSGTVVLNGSSVVIHLTYRFSYPFLFDVEGVRASVPVTLQIPNETVTGTGGGYYFLMIPNGTSSWNATAPGYQAQNGTVFVQGLPESNVVGVHFEVLPSGLSNGTWFEIVVALTVIVAGAVVLLSLRRKGGGRTGDGAPASPTSSPPPSHPPPSRP